MASSESRISPPVNVSTIAATSSAAPAARNAIRAAPRRRIAAHAARSAPRRSAAMTRPRGNDSDGAEHHDDRAGGEQDEDGDRRETPHGRHAVRERGQRFTSFHPAGVRPACT